MKPEQLAALLEQVSEGAITPDAAFEALSVQLEKPSYPYAQLDLERPARTGTPEVIYGAGKTATQIAGLLKGIASRGQVALATRVTPDKAEEVQKLLPDLPLRWHEVPGILEVIGPVPSAVGDVLVVSAGTSDLPVAEEAMVVLRALGNRVEPVVDVGIAGIHRILGRVERLRTARVIVVVAGMDGALPAVVAGLVRAPVIAVPTSVGYGAAFGGLAPLLTMLNACAPGVGVVNIDNGFGAAMLAHRINQGV